MIRAFQLSKDEEYSAKEKELLAGAQLGIFEASRILSDNEIFFPDSLRRKSQDLNAHMLQYAGGVTALMTYLVDKLKTAPENRKNIATSMMKESMQSIDKITPLLDDLRKEFQSILGIEEPKK